MFCSDVCLWYPYVLLMFCYLVILLSYCSLAPLPCLHPRLAVVVLEATHPIPPQYWDNAWNKECFKKRVLSYEAYFFFFLIFTYDGISLRYLYILIATYLYSIKKGFDSINNYKFDKVWLAFVKFTRHIYQILNDLDERFGDLDCD
jgi:hypothetical protein